MHALVTEYLEYLLQGFIPLADVNLGDKWILVSKYFLYTGKNKLIMLHKHIMKQHKEEDPRYFECHICKFQTFIKTELELHVKSLHMVHQKDAPKKEIKVEQTGGVEDIRCDLCFFKTKSPTGIKIHCKRMHAVTSVNKFKCDQCDANLRTPQRGNPDPPCYNSRSRLVPPVPLLDRLLS